ALAKELIRLGQPNVLRTDRLRRLPKLIGGRAVAVGPLAHEPLYEPPPTLTVRPRGSAALDGDANLAVAAFPPRLDGVHRRKGDEPRGAVGREEQGLRASAVNPVATLQLCAVTGQVSAVHELVRRRAVLREGCDPHRDRHA